MSSLFHLAFPISNIQTAQNFYADKLGFELGRVSEKSIIFNFFGHQIIGHMVSVIEKQHTIYPRHFGIIFDTLLEYNEFLKQVKETNVSFHIAPKIRFAGQITQHYTFFLEDPFHNYLEFKFYCHQEAILGNVSRVIGDTVSKKGLVGPAGLEPATNEL